MGGRISPPAAWAMMVIALSWLGIVSLMVALIPVIAIAPILLYIGMLIGSQAFQECPKRHAPAIVRLWFLLFRLGNCRLTMPSVPSPTSATMRKMIASMKSQASLLPRPVGAGRWIDSRGRHSWGHHDVIIDRKLMQACFFFDDRRGADLLRPDTPEEIGTGKAVVATAYLKGGRRAHQQFASALASAPALPLRCSTRKQAAKRNRNRRDGSRAGDVAGGFRGFSLSTVPQQQQRLSTGISAVAGSTRLRRSWAIQSV